MISLIIKTRNMHRLSILLCLSSLKKWNKLDITKKIRLLKNKITLIFVDEHIIFFLECFDIGL